LLARVANISEPERREFETALWAVAYAVDAELFNGNIPVRNRYPSLHEKVDAIAPGSWHGWKGVGYRVSAVPGIRDNPSHGSYVAESLDMPKADDAPIDLQSDHDVDAAFGTSAWKKALERGNVPWTTRLNIRLLTRRRYSGRIGETASG
jgi:hypothetical protein